MADDSTDIQFPDDPAQADHGTSQPPFSPPTDPVADAAATVDQRTSAGQLDDTHPATDSNLESQQVYDEGVAGGAEAAEPQAGNAVADYHPDEDKSTDV